MKRNTFIFEITKASFIRTPRTIGPFSFENGPPFKRIDFLH